MQECEAHKGKIKYSKKKEFSVVVYYTTFATHLSAMANVMHERE
jgi:hypothetical protein